jgi:metal-sulfur cluster biosynthetic enzyme
MKWGDGSFTEYFVTDQQTETITFKGYDESIISVSDKGVVTALKTGETEVTMTVKGKSCKIKVVVTDKIEDGFYRLPDLKEIDYTNLDFSVKGTEKAISSTNSATVTYDMGEGAIKCQVTGNDALFYLSMGQSIPLLKADDYKTLEITYKCPTDTSKKAINLQVFYAAGSIKDPDAGHQVMKSISKDGEYHTITIDLSTFKDWDGDINLFRIDFFDQSEVGDTMYIKSIKLIKK